MSLADDRHYFLRRAEEELHLGDVSPSSRVAAVHYELALRYSLLCEERSAVILPFRLAPAVSNEHRESAEAG